jgi:hypothetical protein
MAMLDYSNNSDTSERELFLRELGVYSFPDGREFVAHAAGAEGYSLYTIRAWKTFGIAEYRVHADGKILSKGTPTKWSAEDLRDTGRSVLYLSQL